MEMKSLSIKSKFLQSSVDIDMKIDEKFLIYLKLCYYEFLRNRLKIVNIIAKCKCFLFSLRTLRLALLYHNFFKLNLRLSQKKHFLYFSCSGGSSSSSASSSSSIQLEPPSSIFCST